MDVPAWVQITDYDAHALWLHPNVTGYFTGNEKKRHTALPKRDPVRQNTRHRNTCDAGIQRKISQGRTFRLIPRVKPDKQPLYRLRSEELL